MMLKDGHRTILTLQLKLPAFWSDDLQKWVLDREGKFDSFRPDHPAIIKIDDLKISHEG